MIEALPIGKRVRITRQNGTQLTGTVQREAEPGMWIIQAEIKPDPTGPPPQPLKRIHISEVAKFEELDEVK